MSLGTSLPSKIPKPIELSTFRVKDLRISQTLETNAEMKYLRKLRTSIEENGISYDLSFDQQIHVFEYEGVNYLVNGHNRFAVAQKLGITELKGISISEGYLMERYSVTPQLLKGHSEKAIQIGNKLRW